MSNDTNGHGRVKDYGSRDRIRSVLRAAGEGRRRHRCNQLEKSSDEKTKVGQLKQETTTEKHERRKHRECWEKGKHPETQQRILNELKTGTKTQTLHKTQHHDRERSALLISSEPEV